MEGRQSQEIRRKKIQLPCENIAIIIVWVCWIILVPLPILIIMPLIASCPIINDNVKFFIQSKGKSSGIGAGPGTPVVEKADGIFVTLVIVGSIEIGYFILAFYFGWISTLVYSLVFFGLAGGFALLLYWGSRTRLDAEYSRATELSARKAVLRRWKIKVRNQIIPLYSCAIGQYFVMGPFFYLNSSVLVAVSYTIFASLFLSCIALTVVLVKIILHIKDLLLAQLKGAISPDGIEKGVDLAQWAQETSMAVSSLRGFIRQWIRIGTIAGTFNKQKTYFSVDPKDPRLGI